MRQNYFIVDGEKYYTGTIFLVYKDGKQVEASFIYYDTKYKKYVYKIRDCIWSVNDDLFKLKFISVTNKVDSSISVPKNKTMKDSEIDGLFIGWAWYIVLMAVSTICNDAIGLWICISIIFFNWRSKKIKEEGTYVEW